MLSAQKIPYIWWYGWYKMPQLRSGLLFTQENIWHYLKTAVMTGWRETQGFSAEILWFPKHENFLLKNSLAHHEELLFLLQIVWSVDWLFFCSNIHLCLVLKELTELQKPIITSENSWIWKNFLPIHPSDIILIRLIRIKLSQYLKIYLTIFGKMLIWVSIEEQMEVFW